MAFEHRDGSGSLFRAEKKSEKAPDMRGDLMLNGVLYELAGWKKEGKNGSFLSLSAKPKEERKSAPSQGASVDSDIPFAPVGKHGY